MPASQPIDIPDAKKRNKKKKRCRATDSFSGRFEGECERVYQGLKVCVCVRARVCFLYGHATFIYTIMVSQSPCICNRGDSDTTDLADTVTSIYPYLLFY